MTGAAPDPAPDPRLALAAWTKVCHHCDGIALGTTVAALAARGAFALLDGPAAAPDRLAALLGFSPGYFRLACKLLASQGFLHLGPDGAVAPTPDGRRWLAQVGRYADAARRVAEASALFAALAGSGGPLAAARGLPEDRGDPLADRVSRHLRGPIAAAALLGLSRSGRLADAAPGDAAGARAWAALRAEGWADGHALTPEGRVAATFAAQYAYPVCYLPTYAAVPALLAGSPAAGPAPGGAETHVDRALDIDFSGLVFARTCKEPFLELALPLFDAEDLAAQPAAVVDTGSGDGTLLAELHRAVKERTRRGSHLERHPLTLVGVEANEVARAATARRLAGLGAPWRALAGDVGDPAGIARSLERSGVEPRDALHVSKSVLHNRTYRRPARPAAALPATRAVFVDADGAAIDPALAVGSLVELLAAWAPLVRRHGMIVAEAHTVDPALAAARVGRSLVTPLDASHGYSRQLLVEVEVHRAAVALAGYRTLAARDVGAAMVGRPLMSVDHVIPAP